MNLLTVLGLLAVLLAPVSAAPPKDNAPKVKESVVPPRVWALHSSPPPDHIISLRIGLPQEKFHILEEHLLEISDPDHDRYGAHLSKEEVHELLAPPQESVELVSEWLASHGIVEGDLVRSPAKDWVTIRVPVSLAEKMLDTVRRVQRLFALPLNLNILAEILRLAARKRRLHGPDYQLQSSRPPARPRRRDSAHNHVRSMERDEVNPVLRRRKGGGEQHRR